MWRRSLPIYATTAALLFGYLTPVVAQTDAERLAARTAAQAGDKAMAEGRYSEALDYFVRAEAAHHAPTLVLRIGRAHAKLGEFVRAREAFLSVKREVLNEDSPAAFRKAQEDAIAELPQVEAHIGTVTLIVVGPPRDALRLNLDGTSLPNAAVGLPYPVDPEKHTVKVEADGFEPASIDFAVKGGGRTTVNIALERRQQTTPQPQAVNDSRPSPEQTTRVERAATSEDTASAPTNWMRVGAYGSFGVGVVGLGLGAYFQLQSASYDEDAEEEYQRCLSASGSSTCTNVDLAENVFALEKHAKGAHKSALTFLAIGGVGVAAGVVLFLLSNDEADTKSAWTPFFDGNQLGVSGNF